MKLRLQKEYNAIVKEQHYIAYNTEPLISSYSKLRGMGKCAPLVSAFTASSECGGYRIAKCGSALSRFGNQPFKATGYLEKELTPLVCPQSYATA
jgi:hypothetical protein